MGKGGKKRPKKRRRRSLDEDEEKDYGADPNIPTILTPDELLDKAFRRASKVEVPDTKAFYAARKTASAKLDSVAGTIAATLGGYVAAFPDFNALHPFHRDLYMIIFDLGRTQKALASLQWCSRQAATICRKGASQINRSKSREFIGTKIKESYGRVSSVVKQVGKDMRHLAKVRELLDRIPKISVDVPTVVVAGAPNVGKSLLVRDMSTGKPEVAPYPFTTKAVSVGHFNYKRIRFQVLDTPGLLDRPLKQRNKIELQAIMALRHLAQATIFMFDPTEECGSDMASQIHLLEEVKSGFVEGSRIYLVFNKSDIRDRWTEQPPEGTFVLSAKEGNGVEELKEEVSVFLKRQILDSGRLF